MKKKIVSVIAVIAIIISCFSVGALAQSPYEIADRSITRGNLAFKNAYGRDYTVNSDIAVTTGSSYMGYVVVIQDCLNLLAEAQNNPYYNVGDVDGKFGTNTFNAVCTFQANEDLSPVDGIVGPETWTKLYYLWITVLEGCPLPHLTVSDD